MTAPLNQMLVKIVTDTITTDTAGNTVEAIPVYPSEVPVQDSSGKYVTPTEMVEDDAGTRVRLVPGVLAVNGAGRTVGSVIGNISPEWAAGVDLWSDFVANSGNLADPTDTHAQTIYAPNAAGVYAPFTANVLVRNDLGLQTVPTRTNLLLRSQEFSNASWVKAATSVSADAAAAPDGTMTADRVTADGSSAPHNVNQAQTGTVAAYTYSIFAKAGTQQFIQLRFSAALGGGRGANFDLSGAGTTQAIPSGAPTSQRITALGNGWYKCEVTDTLLAGTGACAVYMVTAINAAGAETNTSSGTVDLWQAQLELGVFGTPPIPTTSATVIVNGNRQVISGIGTQIAAGVSGILQFNPMALGSGAFEAFMYLSDGTTNNKIQLYNNGTNFRFDVAASGVTQADFSVKAIGTGQQTIAFAVGPNFADCRAVGSADPGADTGVTFPAMDRIAFGGRGFNASFNAYQRTAKVALKFGAQSQATFDAMYARAVLAAAA